MAYVEKIQATIQLDKLVLCCYSTVADNFDDAIKYYIRETLKSNHSFGDTQLTQTVDKSRRYRYSYKVTHCSYYIGQIDFCLLGNSLDDDKIRFTIYNKVFYNNNTLRLLPAILSDLNLELSTHPTRLEIALDCYDFNPEQTLRRALRDKENSVKLMGKYVNDRRIVQKRISYFNTGSLDNPFKIRTIYIKNGKHTSYSKKQNEEKKDNYKPTIQLAAYNKLEEIKNFSPHKGYILDYHREHNPKFKKIYRMEVRLESEELRRLCAKIKRPITIDDLMNKEFLYDIFQQYIDRIIVIRDKNKQKIQLFPTPYLAAEGKLPPPLPEVINDIQIIEIKQYNELINENIINNKINHNTIYNKEIINDLNSIINEKKTKADTANPTKNKQCFKR